MNETTVIEINGVKLEVDLRTAKRIDTLRVGSRVKVLIKGYSEYKVSPGVVVGFDPFENLPSIVVAYMDLDYSAASLKWVTINAQTKDIEIVAALDADHLELNRDNVLQRMDRAIVVEELKVEELRQQRAFFLARFQEYFTDAAVAV